MGIKINDKGLKRFENNLKSDFLDLRNDVAKAMAERGVEIANGKYGSESIQVSAELISNGHAVVRAKGDQLGYLEFGNGIQGDGKYPDPSKLPPKTKKLVFKSRGEIQSTDGWEYNYFKEQKIKQGVPNADLIKDVVGRPPQAQMFYTAQELKAEKGKIIKKVLRGDK